MKALLLDKDLLAQGVGALRQGSGKQALRSRQIVGVPPAKQLVAQGHGASSSRGCLMESIPRFGGGVQGFLRPRAPVSNRGTAGKFYRQAGEKGICFLPWPVIH